MRDRFDLAALVAEVVQRHAQAAAAAGSSIRLDTRPAVDRIFDRFERAVSSRHFGGLGLGLYITRQIVEAHGGSIRVSSRPGEGAEFVVVLPPGP